jgi:hypothetical protein
VLAADFADALIPTLRFPQNPDDLLFLMAFLLHVEPPV